MWRWAGLIVLLIAAGAWREAPAAALKTEGRTFRTHRTSRPWAEASRKRMKEADKRVRRRATAIAEPGKPEGAEAETGTKKPAAAAPKPGG